MSRTDENLAKAERVRRAIDARYTGTNDSLEEDIVDVLTDLIHLCHQQTGMTFDNAVSTARDHFHTEMGHYDSNGRS